MPVLDMLRRQIQHDIQAAQNIKLAVQQHMSGVTGDNTSPWVRSGNTASETLNVGRNWATSAGKTLDAWSSLTKPPIPGGPPPSNAVIAARTLRAAQQTVGAIMSALGVPKDMLDVGFANLTAPLAAIFPSLPAATILSPYIGTPHLHPPSLLPLPHIGMMLLGPTPRVLINYLPAARVGDLGLAPTCLSPTPWFKIKLGSSNVFIGGARAARFTDMCIACKNIPEPPDIPSGKAMAAIGKAADVVSKTVDKAKIVGGALGVVADVAEMAVEDNAAMASAKQLSAAVGAAQMAVDAAKAAVEKVMWKVPTIPPTGSVGAIVDFSHMTVLIGGFPMIDIPDPVGAILNRLKRYKARSADESEATGPKSC